VFSSREFYPDLREFFNRLVEQIKDVGVEVRNYPISAVGTAAPIVVIRLYSETLTHRGKRVSARPSVEESLISEQEIGLKCGCANTQDNLSG
jgi:hypothetical protein